MNDEIPFEGEVPGDGDRPYEWLDEWLCEYVDGTMDPSLKAVFEQYVEANPELKAHVERLQETRNLLCECGLPEEPSSDLESKICTEVEWDMLRSSTPVSDALWRRPMAAFGVASSVVVALVIGFLMGATVVDPPSSTFTASPPSTNRVAAGADPSPSAPTPVHTPWLDPVSTHSPSLSASDSSQHPSTFTRIDLP